MSIKAKYHDIWEKSCSICKEQFEYKHVGQLDCGHRYCCSCITQWAESSTSCPQCRQNYDDIKELAPLGTDTTPYRRYIEVKVIACQHREFQAAHDLFSLEVAQSLADQQNGQRPCHLCGSNHEPDELLHCDLCFRTAHQVCLCLSERPRHAWRCEYCTACPPRSGSNSRVSLQQLHQLLQSGSLSDLEAILDNSQNQQEVQQARSRPLNSVSDRTMQDNYRDNSTDSLEDLITIINDRMNHVAPEAGDVVDADAFTRGFEMHSARRSSPVMGGSLVPQETGVLDHLATVNSPSSAIPQLGAVGSDDVFQTLNNQQQPNPYTLLTSMYNPRPAGQELFELPAVRGASQNYFPNARVQSLLTVADLDPLVREAEAFASSLNNYADYRQERDVFPAPQLYQPAAPEMGSFVDFDESTGQLVEVSRSDRGQNFGLHLCPEPPSSLQTLNAAPAGAQLGPQVGLGAFDMAFGTHNPAAALDWGIGRLNGAQMTGQAHAARVAGFRETASDVRPSLTAMLQPPTAWAQWQPGASGLLAAAPLAHLPSVGGLQAPFADASAGAQSPLAQFAHHYLEGPPRNGLRLSGDGSQGSHGSHGRPASDPGVVDVAARLLASASAILPAVESTFGRRPSLGISLGVPARATHHGEVAVPMGAGQSQPEVLPEGGVGGRLGGREAGEVDAKLAQAGEGSKTGAEVLCHRCKRSLEESNEEPSHPSKRPHL